MASIPLRTWEGNEADPADETGSATFIIGQNSHTVILPSLADAQALSDLMIAAYRAGVARTRNRITNALQALIAEEEVL